MSEKQRSMFLLVAVVLLCEPAIAEVLEEKRCYWCGPLAEQVHRSQRAPTCTQELQETTCDPGYTHCATVATSPPYTESRLCVKFYQDECYSLYCNTTKTWRMICSCQGNICNGQNTDRETKAFATLAKIVAKNRRNKRSLIGDKGFIITPRNKAANFSSSNQIADETNSETNKNFTINETTHSAMLSDEQIEDYNDKLNATSDVTEATDGANIIENTIDRDSEEEMQADQSIKEQASETNAVHIIPFDHQISTVHDGTKIEDMAKSKVDENKDIVTPIMTILEIKNNNNEISAHTTVAAVEETTDRATETSVAPTTIEIELSVVHNQDPKDNLAPPEAIHQNDTPTKVTETTVAVKVTTDRIETTTHLMKTTTKKHIETNGLAKKSQETENNNKNNGEEQSFTHTWEVILLMNLLIYFTL